MTAWLRRSFTGRLFLTMMLVTLVPIVICYFIMLPLLMARSGSRLAAQAQGQLDAIYARFEETVQSLEERTLALSQDARIRPGEAPDPQGYAALFESMAGFSGYSGLYLFDENGVCRYQIGSEAPLNSLPTDWGILRSAGMTPEMVFTRLDGGAFQAARGMYDSRGDLTGYVMAQVNQSSLESLMSGLYDPTNHILLMDARFRPVYQSMAALEGGVVDTLRAQWMNDESLTGGGEEFLYYIKQEPASGFFLLLAQPKMFTGEVMATFSLISWVIGLTCVLVCLFGALVLSRYLSKPVKDLSLAMKQVEGGDTNVRIATGGEDELGRLSASFNRMVEEYQANLIRSVQRQKELNDARIRMMQAQLNPHFLYNTLDTVKWLGITHHVPKAAALATDLAAILRKSVSESEFVTLETELELVEKYVNIQSIRFEDRFTCEMAISDRFQSYLIPKLILQPLVENAIIHGLQDREEGFIKLWAEEHGADLEIFVSDNGCGMPKALIEELGSGGKKPAEGHLGLYNVDSILKLYFGAEYGVRAVNEAEGGSRVSIRLPGRKEGEA
jgi:two-component system sensor histidine kinase YesM